jgi:hypothetical protein
MEVAARFIELGDEPSTILVQDIPENPANTNSMF